LGAVTGWQAFWFRILSPATARFILALLALGVATYALYGLMNGEIVETNREALMLALGVVLGLSSTAYNYYFGSTARGDDRSLEARIVNPPSDPAPTTGQTDWPTFMDATK
jgi:hypothetical protein